jgi:hypothetical protein
MEPTPSIRCLLALCFLLLAVQKTGGVQATEPERDNPYVSLEIAATNPFPWAHLPEEQPPLSKQDPSSDRLLLASGLQSAAGSDNRSIDPRESLLELSDDPWRPQVLPEGIIYHSYWAGLHEPRMGLQLVSESSGGSFWDPTLGGRVGLFRYGNDDPLRPQGWQLDVEGAALARLTLDDMRDLDMVDFRGGVPLTYGIDNWQFKLGYYHSSSHLGDEYAIRIPGSLDDRINYVRDALILGASWCPVDYIRLYAEGAYAFNATGGAEPWEFQFGAEFARAGVTGSGGTPFLAFNSHLREEHNFGGDFNIESGWLWRNQSGHTLRVGAFYFNGKSSQYQFYDDSQQQTGGGVWYDF